MFSWSAAVNLTLTLEARGDCGVGLSLCLQVLHLREFFGAPQIGLNPARVASRHNPLCDSLATPTTSNYAQAGNMVAAGVSLVLRRYRARPLEARRLLIDGNRSSRRSRRGHIAGTRFLCSSSTPPSSDVGAGVEADDLPSLREYIATLGVFFTLPEQGITSPEILTRFDIWSRRVIRPRLWP